MRKGGKRGGECLYRKPNRMGRIEWGNLNVNLNEVTRKLTEYGHPKGDIQKADRKH